MYDILPCCDNSYLYFAEETPANSELEDKVNGFIDKKDETKSNLFLLFQRRGDILFEPSK